MRTRELRQDRAKAIDDCKRILDRARADSRSMNTEEQSEYDRIDSEVDALWETIVREERQAARESGLEDESAQADARRGDAEPGEGDPTAPAEQRYWDSRNRYPITDRTIAGAEYSRAFARGLATDSRSLATIPEAERRALQADIDDQGGYMVASEMFVSRLIQKVDDLVHIRQRATVIPVMSAQSLGAPSLENDPADSDWTTELAMGSADTTMSLGKRSLTPHPLAKQLLVSRKLLNQSSIPTEELVRNRLAYKQAITHEKAFLNGTGASQPLGVFTASADGISTGQDFTATASQVFTVPLLIGAQGELKDQYRPNAAWLFKRNAITAIRELNTANNFYFQPGIQVGSNDSFLNAPLLSSEYAPAATTAHSVFTTATYVGMYADWSHYWIADAMDMQIQRLDELYAATNQVGFFLRSESDGMPVIEEAFVRLLAD